MITTLAWCALMGQLTTRVAQQKIDGMPERKAYQQSQMSDQSDARKAGALVVRYVYQLNDDGKVSPRKMGIIVRKACENPDENTSP